MTCVVSARRLGREMATPCSENRRFAFATKVLLPETAVGDSTCGEAGEAGRSGEEASAAAGDPRLGRPKTARESWGPGLRDVMARRGGGRRREGGEKRGRESGEGLLLCRC